MIFVEDCDMMLEFIMLLIYLFPANCRCALYSKC